MLKTGAFQLFGCSLANKQLSLLSCDFFHACMCSFLQQYSLNECLSCQTLVDTRNPKLNRNSLLSSCLESVCYGKAQNNFLRSFFLCYEQTEIASSLPLLSQKNITQMFSSWVVWVPSQWPAVCEQRLKWQSEHKGTRRASDLGIMSNEPSSEVRKAKCRHPS